MADFKRVPVQRPLPPSRLPTLGWAVAIVLAVAVVKPWDLGAGAAVVPVLEEPTPRAGATEPAETPEGLRRYDPRLFGGREPDPAWELWPAGYVVFFGIAGPVRVDGSPGPGESLPPGPGSSPVQPSPQASRPAAAAPGATPDPDAAFVVDLGPADHLIALGINTPADIRVVDIGLWGEGDGRCCDAPVVIMRLPTLWASDHFTVIGVVDPLVPGEAGAWPPGEYRLDLLTGEGGTRRFWLRVGPPTK